MLVRKKPGKQKISAMVLALAGDFINMGEDTEEKQEYLNSAVSAWNIACLDTNKRKRAIKQYLREYRKLNPTQSRQDVSDVEENLRLLIQEKEKLYPDIKVQIVGATITVRGGKNHVNVMSVPMQE